MTISGIFYLNKGMCGSGFVRKMHVKGQFYYWVYLFFFFFGGI